MTISWANEFQQCIHFALLKFYLPFIYSRWRIPEYLVFVFAKQASAYPSLPCHNLIKLSSVQTQTGLFKWKVLCLRLISCHLPSLFIVFVDKKPKADLNDGSWYPSASHNYHTLSRYSMEKKLGYMSQKVFNGNHALAMRGTNWSFLLNSQVFL